MTLRSIALGGVAAAAMLAACAGASPAPSAPATDPAVPSTVTQALATPPGLKLPAGFSIEIVAHVAQARELVALPNGDLLVGTLDSHVDIVPHADDAGAAGSTETFAAIDDRPDAGIAYAPDRHAVFIGTRYGVYETPYADGDLHARRLTKIASLRACPQNACREDHVTTSLAYANGALYAAAGSDCNACAESDPTRAAISQIDLATHRVQQRAKRIRNAVALTTDPATGAVWAGDAGQDFLPDGHPYEFLDDVTAHPGVADYGWPQCEENHHAYAAGADCSTTVAPALELPAYSTIVGDAFYPLHPNGRWAFPSEYRGALFATAHGSWHRAGGRRLEAPAQVVWFAMRGDDPVTPVNWNDPSAQWHAFVTGFEPGGFHRIGRPTGIAVGPRGSLFVGDDLRGWIYRIRYVSAR